MFCIESKGIVASLKGTDTMMDHHFRPDTSRSMPLVIALVPLKYSNTLHFPHRVPFFTKEQMPWCPCPFNKKKHTGLSQCCSFIIFRTWNLRATITGMFPTTTSYSRWPTTWNRHASPWKLIWSPFNNTTAA